MFSSMNSDASKIKKIKEIRQDFFNKLNILKAKKSGLFLNLVKKMDDKKIAKVLDDLKQKK